MRQYVKVEAHSREKLMAGKQTREEEDLLPFFCNVED
jgi:hypothetical protein